MQREWRYTEWLCIIQIVRRDARKDTNPIHGITFGWFHRSNYSYRLLAAYIRTFTISNMEIEHGNVLYNAARKCKWRTALREIHIYSFIELMLRLQSKSGTFRVCNKQRIILN